MFAVEGINTMKACFQHFLVCCVFSCLTVSGQNASVTLSQVYQGNVATGIYQNDNTGGFQYFMSRSAHYARDYITNVKIVLQNYSFSESASSGIGVYKASIEYPAGTFTLFTCSSSTTCTAASTNSIVTTDTISPAVAIPKGALFWIRILGNSGGSSSNYFPHGNSTLGEGYTFGSQAQPDLTTSGTVSYYNANFKPLAIVSTTASPSVCLIGDSRVQGLQDTYDNTGDLGTLARQIGQTLPYISLAVGGSTVATYATSHTLRTQLAAYCSAAIVAYGINDLYGGISLSTIETNLSAIPGYTPNIPLWIATVENENSSTDNFESAINQTVATSASALNTWIRTVPSTYYGFFELAQNDQPNGYWLFTGGANYATPDGTHQTRALLEVMKAIRVIDPAVFSR